MLHEKDKLFNRYEITQRIGRGRFATVWQAFDPQLDDIMAIKEINIDTGKENNAQDAIHEARLLRSLNSTHILTLWDVGIENDCVYLIMEYADGGTLRQMLDRQGPLSESQVMKLMAQLCEGLAFAHDRDVIHRDLKPENLFISGNIPKIGDFGLGRILHGSQRATSAGTGTLGYRAPEQYRKGYDKRADIWAMGMVTLELLTGELPFDKDADEPEIMFQVMDPNQPIPIAGSVSPGKNPTARLQTEVELQNALESVSSTAPTNASDYPFKTRGGESKGILFKYWYDSSSTKQIVIETVKGRRDEFGWNELLQIVSALKEQFGTGWFPLANNVQKLGNGTEKPGLGTTILSITPKHEDGAIKHAQASSYLGVVLEDIGLCVWNGRNKGIEWRLLVHDLLGEEQVTVNGESISISPAMREVLEKTLAKNPDNRFQTALELQTAFENLNAPPLRSPVPSTDEPQETKPKVETASEYFNKGYAYGELGQYKEAIEAYKKAISIKPDYADAYNNMGIAYRKLEQYQEAIEAYKQALCIDTDYALAYYNMGIAYGNLEQYQEAIEAYKQTLRIDPDYTKAYNNLRKIGTPEAKKVLAEFRTKENG